MSTLATLWALRRCATLSLPATEAALIMALADWTAPDGHCQPPVAALARSAGLGRSTVAAVGAKLERRGLVRRDQPRPTEATVWTLAVDEPFDVVDDAAAPEMGAGTDPAEPQNGPNAAILAGEMGGDGGAVRPEVDKAIFKPLWEASTPGPDSWSNEPKAQGAAPPAAVSGDEVIALLSALGVQADPKLPLFWHRREHRDDVAHVLRVTGLEWSDLLRQCRTLRDDRPPGFRSLRDLVPLLGSAKP